MHRSIAAVILVFISTFAFSLAVAEGTSKRSLEKVCTPLTAITYYHYEAAGPVDQKCPLSVKREMQGGALYFQLHEQSNEGVCVYTHDLGIEYMRLEAEYSAGAFTATKEQSCILKTEK